jgi:hypothetical protein
MRETMTRETSRRAPRIAFTALAAACVLALPRTAAAQGPAQEVRSDWPAADAIGAVNGQQVVGYRIVGGTTAPAGAWPSVVAIYKRGFANGRIPICGGTIVDRQWVLTAAHCVYRQAAGTFFIREGALNLSGGSGRTINVTQVVWHERFSPSPPANDIALLRLETPSQQPAQTLLAGAGRATVLRAGALATVVGYGRVRPQPMNAAPGFQSGPGSDILLQVDLPVVETDRCRARYNAQAINDGTVCAGYEDGGRDSCQGDSGGPLFVRGALGAPVQVGIVSWGPGCAQPRAYGVYTSVGQFEGWIRQRASGASFSGAAPPSATAQANPRPPAGAAPQRPPPQAAGQRPPSAGQRPPPAQGAAPAAAAVPATAAFAVTDATLGSALATQAEVAPSQVAQVTVDVVPARVMVGQTFTVRVTSTVAGDLVVFNEDERGNMFQIFPNQHARGTLPGQAPTRIAAGQTITIPGPGDGFALRVTPPAGANRIIAAVVPVEAHVDQVTAAAQSMENLGDPQAYLEALADRISTSRGVAVEPRSQAFGQRHYEIVGR